MSEEETINLIIELMDKKYLPDKYYKALVFFNDLYYKQKEIIKVKDKYIAGLHQDLQEAIDEIDRLRGDKDE